MIPNVELQTTLTAMRQAEIQREVAGARQARRVRSVGAGTMSMRRVGPPITWLRALRSSVAPGAALPPVA